MDFRSTIFIEGTDGLEHAEIGRDMVLRGGVANPGGFRLPTRLSPSPRLTS